MNSDSFTINSKANMNPDRFVFTLCIMYEDNNPLSIWINEFEALHSMIRYCKQKILFCEKILKGNTTGYENMNIYDTIDIKMDCITYLTNGTCIFNKPYIYDTQSRTVRSLHNSMDDRNDTITCEYPIRTDTLSSEHKVYPFVNKYNITNSNPLDLHLQNTISNPSNSQNFKNISFNNKYHQKSEDLTDRKNDKLNIRTTSEQDYGILQKNIKFNNCDNLENELLKLTQNLNPTIKKDLVTSINQLEDIYTGLSEEAFIDADIKKLKEEMDKQYHIYSKSESDDISVAMDDDDDDGDGDVVSDDDLVSDIDKHYDDKETTGTKMEKNIRKDIEITHDMPDELKILIQTRNTLNGEIKNQQIIVDKANENLNDDVFIKRCEEQNKRKLEQKKNEGISIMMSDKNTYLKICSKIKKEILHEHNISPLFMYKYHIIKFMEKHNLISFKLNANIETEYHVFSQLQKVMDIFESNNDDKYEVFTLIENLDPKYLELCMEFLNLLETSDRDIMSDKIVHSILNENPEIKKIIFKEAADTSVFERDTDKKHYDRLEKENK